MTLSSSAKKSSARCNLLISRKRCVSLSRGSNDGRDRSRRRRAFIFHPSSRLRNTPTGVGRTSPDRKPSSQRVRVTCNVDVAHCPMRSIIQRNSKAFPRLFTLPSQNWTNACTCYISKTISLLKKGHVLTHSISSTSVAGSISYATQICQSGPEETAPNK